MNSFRQSHLEQVRVALFLSFLIWEALLFSGLIYLYLYGFWNVYIYLLQVEC